MMTIGIHENMCGKCAHHGITAPVLETEVAKVANEVEPLGAANVPIAALLDLGEQPRFDQRASVCTETQSA